MEKGGIIYGYMVQGLTTSVFRVNNSFLFLGEGKEIMEVFGTAPQTLLHKLHHGAALQKTGVCGAPL
jgi:hypothetical protein